MSNELTTKICTKCKEIKPLKDFSKSKNHKDGLSSHCKRCHSIDNKKWRDNNKIVISKYNKEYIKQNNTQTELIKTYQKNYQKIYRENNKEQKRILNVKNKATKRNPEYYILNKEKIDHQNKLYRNLRRKNDPIFKLQCNIRTLLWGFLRGNKNLHTHEYICCSSEELWTHLERQFRDGMTRVNYGKIWHVDHIIPLSYFNETDLTESKLANHWGNLQPLFAKENLEKGDKIPEKTNFKY